MRWKDKERAAAQIAATEKAAQKKLLLEFIHARRTKEKQEKKRLELKEHQEELQRKIVKADKLVLIKLRSTRRNKRIIQQHK